MEFFVPPGHFYSPIVNAKELNLRSRTLNQAIDLNIDNQLSVLKLCGRAGEIPFKEPTTQRRYFSANDQFGDGDAFFYSAMIKILKPKNIIEIGSGFSSALALDVIEKYKLETNLICIDPFPERLKSLIWPQDQIQVLEKRVQDVPIEFFAHNLQSRDILFIDSSHVAKSESDVIFEISSILPSLQKGVYIFIHDMFFPFEYPKKWLVEDNRSWNELYFVETFLMYNKVFQIECFQDYLATRDEFKKEIPHEVSNPGGGLWLQKMG